MAKVVCITAARMTSSRLPGKAMMDISGRPMIDYHVKRLLRSKHIDEVYVATTTNKTDDVLEDFCHENSFKCYRGSEDDVLSRFYECAKNAKADILVRVTADCPLIDPVLIDDVIECFMKDINNDYVHLDINKYPRGFDCEVFSRKVLDEIQEKATLGPDREHLTRFIYTHPDQYKITSVTMENNFSDLRFCVDEEADLELIKNIVEHFGEKILDTSWKSIIALVKEKTELQNINKKVVQHIPEV